MSCLDSEKYSKRIQYNSFSKQEIMVCDGTPGFFIVGPDFDQETTWWRSTISLCSNKYWIQMI